MKREHKQIPREPMRYFFQVAFERKWLMLWALFFVTLATALSVAVTYTTKLIVDGVERGSDVDLIWKHAIVLGVVYMCMNPAWRISGYIGSAWCMRTWQSSYNLLFRRLIQHGDRYFSDRFAGAVANKIAHVSDGVFFICIDILWSLYSGLVMMMLSIIVVGIEDIRFAIVFVIWILLFAVLARVMLPKKRKLSYIGSEEHSRLKGLTVDMITNAAAVRQFVRHEWERKRLQKQTEQVHVTGMHSWWYSEFMRLLFSFMNHGLTVFSLFLGVWMWSQDVISAGDIMLFYLLADRMSEQLKHIGMNFDAIMKNYGQMDEWLDEILHPYDIVDTGTDELKVNQGSIVWDNVTFGYNDQKVFDNFHINIKPAQRVGLVGESGAGKSTFVQLLLRQYDIQSGSILFDGQDISHITQNSLRENIAYIPQDPSLFHRSIRENIGYGLKNATDDAIEQAAKMAQAHEFIQKLPDGYDTLVGERWVKLSWGQRQRIVIARAILKNAPILILDEATSALDSESEQKIQEALHELMRGKTVIVIAHRLSTIKHLDRILVFSQGEIIEDGNHDELMLQWGKYADLWNAQSDGFLSD